MNMVCKVIKFRDRDVVLYGKEGDSYFDHFTLDDKTNDFFMKVVESFIPDDAIVFDVGANIGVTSTILALSLPNGTVYSFEPSPTAFPFLKATINGNQLSNCFPYQIALADKDGELAFLDNPTSASASHLQYAARTLGGSSCSVQATSIDRFVEENDIERLDFIKIDVEGFEGDVLRGAKRTLDKFRPAVFLEFNSFTLIAFGNCNPHSVLETLINDFSYVYRFNDGALQEIRSEASILAFIHDNFSRWLGSHPTKARSECIGLKL